MIVTLYRVGRNLNRAYRTCFSFGISAVELVECTGTLQGNLYSATGRIDAREADWPQDLSRTVIAETDGDVPVQDLDWARVDRLVVGGESVHLPAVRCMARVRIDTPASLCLTTEAALAVLLHERLVALARPKNWRYVGHGLYASALPRARDIAWAAAERGIRTAIDLTQRPRPTVERACKRAGIEYRKMPTAYDASPEPPAGVLTPALVFCFHGRDRTGRFIDRWLETQR